MERAAAAATMMGGHVVGDDTTLQQQQPAGTAAAATKRPSPEALQLKNLVLNVEVARAAASKKVGFGWVGVSETELNDA